MHVCLKLSVLALVASASIASAQSNAELKQRVADTERAFAKSMADRNFETFKAYLSDEAVFFGGANALRGKTQVADAWKRFFDNPAAPFSWEPETVEVLDSGTLALSTGPVRNAAGKVTSTFQSIWRLEKGGWKIVFDKGSPVCDCAKQ